MTLEHDAAPAGPARADRSSPEIRILGGDPSPQEIAAVTAVLASALDELAREDRTEETPLSVWARTRRALRSPLSGDWAHPLG